MGGDHKCPVCQATFTRPQHVARHMRSHTGDRPYKCTHCGDQFARSDLLSRHINKCHASEKDKTPLAPNGRRKGGSTRATTSKQACDQCVQGSLPCDGCNPCAKCVQRKVRCTFVKFHRQTAPVGPGHNPRPTATALPSTILPPIPIGARDWGSSFSFPSGPYPTDLDDYANKYRQQREVVQGIGRAPDPNWMYQPSNGAEILGVGGSLSRQNSLGQNQPAQEFYSYRPESADSSSSASSSAASSSVHLPLEAYGATQSSVVNPPEGGFSSAFGLMSLDDPAVLAGFATDGQPFFDHMNQQLQSSSPHPPIPPTNPQLLPHPNSYQYHSQSVVTPRPSTSSGVIRDDETRELREFWKEYMRTPMAINGNGMDQPTPHRRQRVSSLPSVKTPTENIYGNGRTMHDADDLRSYEAAVLARKAPMQLSLNSGLKGRRERSATSTQHPNLILSPPPPPPPNTHNHLERAGSFSGAERPTFKRLPSQVLEPLGGNKKQRGGSEPEPNWASHDWSMGVKDED